MARRDRVPLTTPITPLPLKGWRVDKLVHFDLESGIMSGSISFYDSAGKWVSSVTFDNVGSASVDLVLTAATLNTLANAIVAKLQARDPTLAGNRITDTVADANEVVPNP